jgi:hypothetical protein
MDLLAQYGAGHGTFKQHDNVALSTPGGVFVGTGGFEITDQSIRDMLDANISDPNGPVSYPDANTVYFVFTAPGSSVDYAVNNNFVGYHSSFTDSRGETVVYAVIPHAADGSTSAFDQMTNTSSHELAEAVTNPTGQGWYDDQIQGENEIGDLADHVSGLLAGYNVQGEWSNSQQTGVLPADARWLTWDATNLAPEGLPTVANAISHSEEHYLQFVSNAYQQYLGRSPDQNGLSGWTWAMEHGLTDEQLEAGFIGSAEYIADHGGSNANWVTGMYQDLLGRTPSQSEVDGWVNALNQGMTPQAVAYGFAASTEREGQRVQADYQKYLGRSASGAEVPLWVGAFENGYTNEDVVAGFLGSVEYFQGHASTSNVWLDAAYRDALGRPIDDASLAAWDRYLL